MKKYDDFIDEIGCYTCEMLPLSQREEDNLKSFMASNGMIPNNNVLDVYNLIITDNTHFDKKTKKDILRSIQIFSDFIKESRKKYPEISSEFLMDVAFIQKICLINDNFKEIREFILRKLQKGNRLLCTSKKPFISSRGHLHLSENDIRLIQKIADFSLIDELIDKDYESCIGRLIVYKQNSF